MGNWRADHLERGRGAFGAALQPDGTLLLSGSVDELSVDDFREHLRQCLEASSTPGVDVSDVDFLPSLAVGVLVGALQHDPPVLTAVARKGASRPRSSSCAASTSRTARTSLSPAFPARPQGRGRANGRPSGRPGRPRPHRTGRSSSRQSRRERSPRCRGASHRHCSWLHRTRDRSSAP